MYGKKYRHTQCWVCVVCWWENAPGSPLIWINSVCLQLRLLYRSVRFLFRKAARKFFRLIFPFIFALGGVHISHFCLPVWSLAVSFASTYTAVEIRAPNFRLVTSTNEFLTLSRAPNESKNTFPIPAAHTFDESCWNGVGQGAPSLWIFCLHNQRARSQHYFPHVRMCEHRLLAKARQDTLSFCMKKHAARICIANIKFKSNFLWCDGNREAADCFMYVLSRERCISPLARCASDQHNFASRFSLALCTRGTYTHTGELYRVRFTTFMGER